MAKQVIFFIALYEYGQGLVNLTHPEKSTYQFLAYEQLFKLGQKAFEKNDIPALNNIYPTLIEDMDVRVLAVMGYNQPRQQVASWMQAIAHSADYDIERLNIAVDLAQYTGDWHFYTQAKTDYYKNWCPVRGSNYDDDDMPVIPDVVDNLEKDLNDELKGSQCPTELLIQWNILDYFAENLYDNFKGDACNQKAIQIIEAYKRSHYSALLEQDLPIRQKLVIGARYNLN